VSLIHESNPSAHYAYHNRLAYAALVKIAGDDAARFECLCPDPGSSFGVIEKRKNEYVKLFLQILALGGDAATIPAPCDCDAPGKFCCGDSDSLDAFITANNLDELTACCAPIDEGNVERWSTLVDIPSATASISVDLDSLSAPAWIATDKTVLIANEVFVTGDVPEVSVNQINNEVLGSGRVWDFFFDGVAAANDTHKLQLVFERVV
jgi:hypothetical protein